jgi:hypothetical protein
VIIEAMRHLNAPSHNANTRIKMLSVDPQKSGWHLGYPAGLMS